MPRIEHKEVRPHRYRPRGGPISGASDGPTRGLAHSAPPMPQRFDLTIWFLSNHDSVREFVKAKITLP